VVNVEFSGYGILGFVEHAALVTVVAVARFELDGLALVAAVGGGQWPFNFLVSPSLGST